MRFWNMQPDNWKGRMGVWAYDDDDLTLERPRWHVWLNAGQLRVFNAPRDRLFQLRVVAGMDTIAWRHRFPALGEDAWCAWRTDGTLGWGAGEPGRRVDDEAASG